MENTIAYLSERGVKDEHYRNFVLSSASNAAFKLCSHVGFDFMVSHFLDASSKQGYGIQPTNRVLHMNDDELAIGLVEGDDVICMNLQDGSIYLWMIQTGKGEHVKVADSFVEFLSYVIDK